MWLVVKLLIVKLLIVKLLIVKLLIVKGCGGCEWEEELQVD